MFEHASLESLVYVANTIGITAGWVSICIAIYLNFIADAWVEPRYIFAFFLVGAYFVLSNTPPSNDFSLLIVGSKIIGGLLVLASEAYVFDLILQKRGATNENIPQPDKAKN